MGTAIMVVVISTTVVFAQNSGDRKVGAAGDPSTRNVPDDISTKETPPPDFADVSYGPHEKNVLDVWKAKGDAPAPAIVYIHGGGFVKGDKTRLNGIDWVDTGGDFAVISLNYRLTGEVSYPAQMHDCARAVQFLRANAAKFNIDPDRIALTGISAGAGISLWIAFHDDMADPKSDDPVRRMSTRVSCVVVHAAQCTYDPREVKEIVPGSAYKIREIKALYGVPAAWDWDSDAIGPDLDAKIKDSSPLTHLGKGDPPVYVMHSKDKEKDGDIHHANFGRHLQKKMKEARIECIHEMCPTYRELGTSHAADKIMFLKKYLKMTESQAASSPASREALR